MTNNKLAKIVTNAVVSSTLILTLGTGTAFANEVDTEGTEVNAAVTDQLNRNQIELAEDKSEDNHQSILADLTDDEVNSEEGSTEIKELDNPSLIPGDFFYFIKKVTENIRLALTFDDYKEAQLLAKFAAERIVEANALLTEGEVEEAEEYINIAISTQEQAGEILSQYEDIVEDDVETEAGSTEGEVTKESATEEAEEQEVDKIEVKLANNIDALLVVLEKVENPKAQAAIMKNIHKSFVKLEKKLKKREELEKKFIEKMVDIEAKFDSGQISEEEADREGNKLLEELYLETKNVDNEEVREVEEINREVAKEVKEAEAEEESHLEEGAEKVVKQEREAAKAEREAEREAAKAEREAAKAERKAKREAAKAEREAAKEKQHEHKGNNGKGNE